MAKRDKEDPTILPNGKQKNKEVVLSEQLFMQYESDSLQKDWADQAMSDDEFRNGQQWTREQQLDLEQRGQAAIRLGRSGYVR